jgi:hypothetical protein
MINNNKPLVVFQSSFLQRSGYSDWSLALGKSLLRYCKKKDYELAMVSTPWGACGPRNMTELIQDPENKELVERVLRTNLNKQPDIYFHVSIPNEFQPHGKYNIGVSALTENTCLSPLFLEGLNRTNLNIVMSQFNKDVAEKTEYVKKNPNGSQEALKLTSKIETLFWGIDTSIYRKTDEKIQSIEEEMSKIPESFAFFYSGMWSGNMNSDRKDTGKLIETFLKTFANIENPPCLIMKVNGAQIGTPDRAECINKLNEITNMVKNQLGNNVKLPNVYIIYGELSSIEMNALFNSPKIKTFVSFSHGESWSWSCFHASCIGLPVLTGNWGGVCDYLSPQYCDFLEGELKDIDPSIINDWFVKDSKYFYVNYEKAGAKMLSYFNNYSQTIIDNAEKLRIENVEKFSINKMDERFHMLLDKYIPPIAKHSTIVLPKLRKITLPKLLPIENNNQPSTK